MDVGEDDGIFDAHAFADDAKGADRDIGANLRQTKERDERWQES